MVIGFWDQDDIFLLQYSKTMKRLLLLLLLLMNMVSGCGVGKAPVAEDGRMQVVASFFPMAEFARAVGGEHIQLTTLVPDGAEAHDWEPSPRDLTRLGHARVFVYNGMVEPWAHNALEALSERPILAVQAGAGLYERDGRQDPHVWISPKKAVAQVQRIVDAFCEADAANAAYYRSGGERYIAQLRELDDRLHRVVESSPKKVFVTSHAAFGHLADDYGLRQLAVNGLSPDAEPTPADLQRLIATVRREQVGYIFFETLTDPKIARLLAEETGAQVSVLDPMEGLDEEGRAAGMDYLKLTGRNIENLRQALR